MIEIIAIDLDDIREAAEGGADRIELIANLGQGGHTPPESLIQSALDGACLPLHVMLRPTSKSFVYSRKEKEQMKVEARFLESLGVDHVVLGLLDEEGLADTKSLEDILRGTLLTATFHRAFDESSDLLRSLERINDCHRITHLLTSGGPGKVTDNLLSLKEILQHSRPRVILGSGVNVDTLEAIRGALGSHSFDLHVGTGVRGGESKGVDSHLVCDFVEKAIELHLV